MARDGHREALCPGERGSSWLGRGAESCPRGRTRPEPQVWRTRLPAEQESGPPSYQASLFWRKQTTWLTWKVGEEFVVHRVDIHSGGKKGEGNSILKLSSSPGWQRWVEGGEVSQEDCGRGGRVQPQRDLDRLRRQKAMRSEGLNGQVA